MLPIHNGPKYDDLSLTSTLIYKTYTIKKVEENQNGL
jgi:hypothetical protein